MGWETRGGRGRYYTRSIRQDGRVRREYVGIGPHAEAIARADRLRRENTAAERARMRSAFQQLDDVDQQVKAFCDAVETVRRVALLSAGYHRHARGAWRRRRA